MSARRSFLLLQGVCSPFFQRLADRLAAEGHRVTKVNFACGDDAYWWPRNSVSFRGDPTTLPAFLEEQYRHLHVTDQVLFGDRRPVHRPAVALASRFGVRTHVLEEGYFRPYWVTLERDGVNARSLMPRDPHWYREASRRVPDYGEATPFPYRFWVRALHDVCYHVANAANAVAYPRYRTHAPVTAPTEFAGYLRRFLIVKCRAKADAEAINRLIAKRVPYFLLPLQLNGDAQIRDHSPFRDMAEVIATVVESFARHAPAACHLVIKNHPLDMALVNYSKLIARLACRCDVAGRVHYIETGDLGLLLHKAKGVVTVNSTVGSLALSLGCPTFALSSAIYALPGLTASGDLAGFWSAPQPPDPALFRAFRNTVIHTTQVNGGFYCPTGIGLAVENAWQRLVAQRSPLEELG